MKNIQYPWVVLKVCLFILLITPSVSFGASSVQVSGSSSSDGYSISTSLSPTNQGNMVLVCLETGQPVTSVVDNKSNVYTGAGFINNGNTTLSLYYAYNSVGGVTSVTAQYGAWTSFARMVVSEYSGISVNDPLSAVSTNNNGYNGGSYWTSGNSAVSSDPNQLIVGCAADFYGASTVYSPGTNFTLRRTEGSLLLEDMEVSSVGTYAATGNHNLSSGYMIGAIGALFRTADGGSGGVTYVDNQPPSTPSGVAALGISTSQIQLSWGSSSDNVQVLGYNIYRNGIRVATSTLTSYQDAGLNQSTSYTYTVSAYDNSGNESTVSVPTNGLTFAAVVIPTPPAPTEPSSGGSNDPVLVYASAKAGPSRGWENSASKGASITVWAKNIGTARGANYITVGGVTLRNDSDYAEWGATTNPTTAKGMQRITFWLNSSMVEGNSSGISVTINGVTSNILPFTIDNSAYQRIRFVDTVNGLETNNGQYATQGSGNNGPWKYPFSTTARQGVAPGTFIYMRGGTYTNIQSSGWHAPRGGIVGMAETTTNGLRWYYPLVNGTDALRITMTSYPGEHARFLNSYFSSYSDYWTFTNFTMDGDLTYNPSNNVYMAIVIGMQEGYCASEALHTKNNQLIGLALVGYLHIGAQIWGDNHAILGNYIYNYPTAAGLGADHSYNLYVGSSDNVLIQHNELHGGSRYNIQIYDETRNCAPLYSDFGRGISNVTVDSNLIDINQSKVNPLAKWYGILAGMAWSNGFLNNITIKNNILSLTDNSLNQYHSGIILYQESAPSVVNGFYVYSNTFHGTQFGIDTMQANSTNATNIEVKNNIFSRITSHQWRSSSLGRITPLWSNNLTDKTLSTSGAVVNNGGNVVGNPQFVNEALGDFRLQNTSLALDKGASLSNVTMDYDGVSRPYGNLYDIGAFEYRSGQTSSSGSGTGSGSTGGSTSSGGSGGGQQTPIVPSGVVSTGGGGGGGGAPVSPQQVLTPITSGLATTVVTHATSSTIKTGTKIQLTQQLKIGSKLSQVKVLQTILSQYPQYYPEALVTGYFGTLTRKAIQKIQIAYKISGPGLPGYGEVGPKTRVILNKF